MISGLKGVGTRAVGMVAWGVSQDHRSDKVGIWCTEANLFQWKHVDAFLTC